MNPEGEANADGGVVQRHERRGGAMMRRAREAIRRFEVVSDRGSWRIEPAGYIHYPYAISVVFVMPCPCQKHFWIGVFYLKKRLGLPRQRRFGRDVVTDLDFVGTHPAEGQVTFALKVTLPLP